MLSAQTRNFALQQQQQQRGQHSSITSSRCGSTSGSSSSSCRGSGSTSINSRSRAASSSSSSSSTSSMSAVSSATAAVACSSSTCRLADLVRDDAEGAAHLIADGQVEGLVRVDADGEAQFEWVLLRDLLLRTLCENLACQQRPVAVLTCSNLHNLLFALKGATPFNIAKVLKG